ncbi:PAS domain S-box protein [Belliella buryatensis]|nr:PAS domain S-box protein [Belliella buryatensis]
MLRDIFALIFIISLVSLFYFNLTTLKQKIQKSQTNLDEFNTAFEFAAIGMALVNEKGRFTKVNKSFCKLLGYTPEELTSLTFQEITHPNDLNADLEYVNKLNRGNIESYQIEKRYFNKNGETIWINLSGSKVLNPDGSFKHYIAQIQNITEKKLALDELEKQKTRIENILKGTNVGT